MMRRTDLDALRIVLCAAVILLHAFMIFSADPYYHIKSAQPSPFASVTAELLRVTAMVTFFTIAGYAAVTSLRRRSPLQFMKERALRLLVPLIVGIWTSGTIIKYVEMMHGRDLGLHGLRKARTLQAMLDVEPDVPLGFFDFFPRNLGILNLLTWSHLWFLAYLFLISLLLLPLLLSLARRAPNAARLNAVVLYLPALPLGLYVAASHAYWPLPAEPDRRLGELHLLRAIHGVRRSNRGVAGHRSAVARAGAALRGADGAGIHRRGVFRRLN